MGFKRGIEAYLHNWKINPERKPLILRGARQVGKTTLTLPPSLKLLGVSGSNTKD